jgi:hypothetical protein
MGRVAGRGRRVQMQKTEKTMTELEIDQNVQFEWDKITEAGSVLTPLSGPGCASSHEDQHRPFHCFLSMLRFEYWLRPA